MTREGLPAAQPPTPEELYDELLQLAVSAARRARGQVDAYHMNHEQSAEKLASTASWATSAMRNLDQGELARAQTRATLEKGQRRG